MSFAALLSPPNNQETVSDAAAGFLALMPDLKRRATLLPIGRDKDDELVFAYPQMLVDMVESVMLPGHVVRGGEFTPEDVTRMALDVGMMGAGAGYAKAPRGSLAMGASKKALPMDKASRMARAKQMGFDVDTPVYHGTRSDFRAFKQPSNDLGVHLGTSKAANDRLEQLMTHMDKSHNVQYPERVIKALIKKKKMLELEDLPEWYAERVVGQIEYLNDVHNLGIPKITHRAINVIGDKIFEHKDIVEALKKAGYNGIKYKNAYEDPGSMSYILFDPSDIRSVNAAFDPAKASSADLLAINPATAALPGVAAQRRNQPKTKGKWGEDFL